MRQFQPPLQTLTAIDNHRVYERHEVRSRRTFDPEPDALLSLACGWLPSVERGCSPYRIDPGESVTDRTVQCDAQK